MAIWLRGNLSSEQIGLLFPIAQFSRFTFPRICEPLFLNGRGAFGGDECGFGGAIAGKANPRSLPAITPMACVAARNLDFPE